MRTRIYLRRLPDDPECWDTGPDAPFADLNHDEPLSEESVEVFRELALLAIEAPPPVRQGQR